MKYLSLKKSVILLSIGLLAGFMAILTGCVKQDFDEPPILCVDFPSNATIDTLVKLYGYHTDTVRITQDIVIQGIVSGNDESGNIYKKIYLQDSTAGIDVEIDQTSLYTQFKVGQRVFIKCKGLYLGNYGTALELGYLFNGKIGRIPSSFIKDHIFGDCIPKVKPVPDTIDYNNPPFDKYINRLVAIPNVRFPDAGSPFVVGDVTTSRNIGDANGDPIMMNGNNLILYNSSYASFSGSLLPEGLGTVQGIFTVFNGKFELLVRDLNDMVNFIDTGQTIIYRNNFDVAPSDWVIYTKTGNAWNFDGSFSEMTGNGYGGTAPSDTWLVSPGIDLTTITNPVLTFKTWTQFTDSGLPLPLEVKISTDYSGSGDPSVATWSSLQCTLPAANSKVWTSSGDVSLSAFHQKVYVGYHYRSSGYSSSTAAKWEVDTFKITGKKN
jgi:hypothetical protein